MPYRAKPRIHRTYKCLDLFCGAGGCAMGYWISGFDILGIDQNPNYSKNYPFVFEQGDAIVYLQDLINSSEPPPALIHASPPCQIYSSINNFPSKSNRVDLVDITRDLLLELQQKHPDLVFIIENVAGAPLVDPIELCGATFGLKTYRHRYFEIHPPHLSDKIKEHQSPHIPHVRPQAQLGRRPLPHEFMQVVGGLGDVHAARIAMGINWMTGPELAQAIPPAYTSYLGSYVRNYLSEKNKGKPLFA